jgi:hypothetical protein
VRRLSKPTPLEHALLEKYFERYKSYGFPPVDELSVTDRRNTGAGRYTYLRHSEKVRIGDGELSLGAYSQFDMNNLEAGASFWVNLRDGKVEYLEIIVNGNRGWDGREEPWKILDPDTGGNLPD